MAITGPQMLPLYDWFECKHSRLANDSLLYGQASSKRIPTGVSGHLKTPYASSVPTVSGRQSPLNEYSEKDAYENMQTSLY